LFDPDDAIRTHLDWTEAFRAAIVLGRAVQAEEVARVDRCDLGRWLEDQGKRAYAGHPAFEDLVAAHDAFHAEAARVAELINAGRHDEAEKRLWAGTRYARASQSVCAAIRTLARTA